MYKSRLIFEGTGIIRTAWTQSQSMVVLRWIKEIQPLPTAQPSSSYVRLKINRSPLLSTVFFSNKYFTPLYNLVTPNPVFIEFTILVIICPFIILHILLLGLSLIGRFVNSTLLYIIPLMFLCIVFSFIFSGLGSRSMKDILIFPYTYFSFYLYFSLRMTLN